MTIEKYVEGALRTESPRNPITKEVEDLGLSGRLAHAIIGINTEVGEVNLATVGKRWDNYDRVNILEEIGDIKWYLAVASDILPDFTMDTPLVELLPEGDFDEVLNTLSNRAIEMLDLIKKTMFYGKPLDTSKVIKHLNEINNMCGIIISGFSSTESAVLSTNLAKLSARYPEKFTDFDADNRDLKKERTILEEGANK